MISIKAQKCYEFYMKAIVVVIAKEQFIVSASCYPGNLSDGQTWGHQIQQVEPLTAKKSWFYLWYCR